MVLLKDDMFCDLFDWEEYLKIMNSKPMPESITKITIS